MAGLRELQRAFAASLRDPAAQCPLSPPANLQVYRNNVSSGFRSALAQSFPVISRRVGDAYFQQLAHHYRLEYPSRCGDLHWVGRSFAIFLDQHLRGGDYAWLADLARLEWSCEEASVSAELPVIGVHALADFAPEDFEYLVLALQPSLQLHSSPFPVVSVWLANQAENGPPVDQSFGNERGMVQIRNESVQVTLLTEDRFLYLKALSSGATLGEAMSAADVQPHLLSAILGFVFSSDLVCGVARRNHGS